MSEQASIQNYPAGPLGGSPESATGRLNEAHPLRTLGIAVMGLGVAALAAATFILSYSGIHAMATQAGISPRYASDYPLLIDAMLVITLLAVLALRGAGLPSRLLAWLTLLAVLGVAAGADALHATGRTLPHDVGTPAAAALPWALVLIAFLLLTATLRHARLRRHANVAGRTEARRQVAARADPLPVRVPQPWNSVSIVPGFGGQLVSSAAAGAAAGAAAVSESVGGSPDPAAPHVGHDGNGSDRGPDAADDNGSAGRTADDLPAEVGSQPPGAPSEPADVSPGSGVTEVADTATAEDTGDAAPADQDTADPAPASRELGDVPTADQGGTDDLADGMPVFHRMWSTPTPPNS